mmetsp:Transcript_4784/g.11429  ORF Transcript_4784/g.11429 Transcript_4784/m.11429 type:complete len:279 (-) Transcript_4784:696-1532(-)
MRCAGVREVFPIFTDTPNGCLAQRLLALVLLKRPEEGVHAVALKQVVGCDEGGKRRENVLLDVFPGIDEYLDDGVGLEAARGRVLADHPAYLGRQVLLELGVCCPKVPDELLDQGLDVGVVDEQRHEVEGAAADGDVGVPEAVDNGAPVPLNALEVPRSNLCEGVEGHVSDVVVTVEQELAERVDPEHPQATVRLNPEDGPHALVQDGHAGVLGRLCVGGHLGKNVRHALRKLLVSLTEQPQRVEDLALQERVGEARHVMLRSVAREHQVLEHPDELG